jgi:hypothetical protein
MGWLHGSLNKGEQVNDYTQNANPLTIAPNTRCDQLLLRVGSAAELHQGLVPAIIVGNSIRISVDDLRNWIANQPQVSG